MSRRRTGGGARSPAALPGRAAAESAADSERFVPDWLLEVARTAPDRPAVVDDAGTRWTFAELVGAAERLALGLDGAGLRAGDRVAALLADGAPFVALVHAVRRLGVVLVPLNRRATATELGQQLAEAGARVLVCDETTAVLARAAADVAGATPPDVAGATPPGGGPGTDRRPGRGPIVVAVDEIERLGSRPDRPAAARLRAVVDLAAAATIVFTSGTTGRPKGAVLSHANHRASAAAWSAFLGPRQADRWLACLPLYHVGGLAIVDRAARWGVPVLVQRRFDPAAVARTLVEDEVSHLSLVATMLRALLETHEGRPVPTTLRAVLLGGGPTPAPLVLDASGRGWPVVPTYGMTETASGVTALPAEEAALHPGSAGRPLAGVEIAIRVADRDAPRPDPPDVHAGPGEGVTAPDAPSEDARPGRVGAIGEILVRGPVVFAGYDGRPVETAAALAGGWLRTGDLGSIDEAGRLTVVDRRDDLLISGGENVYPAEVEAVLRAHPAVEDAAVVGRPDARWGSVPVAAVVARPGASIDPVELAGFCRSRLAAYKVPVAFRLVAALPRSAGGKLLRREVRTMLGEGRDG